MLEKKSLFKVYIEGEFAGVVEASCDDNAVSFVFREWRVASFQQVEVSRFSTFSVYIRSG